MTLKTTICLHMGVALTGEARLRGTILDFGGSGQLRAAGNPLKDVRGFAPPPF